jgi:hypothetical protein
MNSALSRKEAAIEAYVRSLIDSVERQPTYDLIAAQQQDALHYHNRNGVTVIALPSSALTEQQLLKLDRYRLLMNILEGYYDAEQAYDLSQERDPLPRMTSTNDIHCLACASGSGQILCYTIFRAVPGAEPSHTMRTRDRHKFPLEELFGFGILDRLEVLINKPLLSVRELEKLSVNLVLSRFDELAVRGPLELGISIIRLLQNKASTGVEAVIGSIGEGFTKRNLDFLGIPTAVIPNALPNCIEDDLRATYLEGHALYPYAFIDSDLKWVLDNRLPQIEQALEQKGKRALLALFHVDISEQPPESRLMPGSGLDPLTNTVWKQERLSLSRRSKVLTGGEQLRKFDPFGGLSNMEASTLRSFMEEVSFQPGELIIQKYDVGDTMYLVVDGQVTVETTGKSGQPLALATLGPGQYFGEIGLLGGRRTANVIALTELKLLQLNRETYLVYLSHVAEIEREMSRTGTMRVADTLSKSSKVDQMLS